MSSESRKKRRKGNDGLPTTSRGSKNFSLQPLLDVLEDFDAPLEESMELLLPDFLHDRAVLQEQEAEKDVAGQTLLRALTRSEMSSFVEKASETPGFTSNASQAIVARKLKLDQERRRAGWMKSTISDLPSTAEPLPSVSSANPERASVSVIIQALESIETTPFENSFLSRLQGVNHGVALPGLVSVDWETEAPWMRLMSDIRDHYSLSHPERCQPSRSLVPITYTSLQPWHLEQVHDLLCRCFWSGIDVRDSLDYSPERCTIVATYNRLVVGVAIISSPRETYITYLAVRAGWENAQIATTMLYHLITLNPHQDITLHVSANSSAMLLYNRFGFKAEEFIAGFYDAYLDPNSRASKNAFRLRLRQQY
ncbi:hypothetical protein FB45DRAFT_926646 [Roridomyces roridus]|uniref:N-acetyltransferase domain-containing protein n=1 Tax=Roridomyces roridus TaxID=1738132 RepID=A0AAD7BKK6_9AGAR|nr:hypothetical protein FB45DRAFT_926646 [Roridomyces roridus]